MLSDAKCRAAKPAEKPAKLSDGESLYLLVTPGGSKLWRFDYRFGGRRKTLAFGAYPAVSLSEARYRRALAKTALASGRDPAISRAGEAPTFRAMAEQWVVANSEHWVEKHHARVRWILETHLYPHFGELPLDEVSPKVVLAAIRIAEEKGLGETVRRMRQITSAVFRFAIAADECERDPAESLRGAIKKKRKAVHMARLDPADLPDFFAKLAAYEGERMTALAVEFVMHTLTRTGEVRFAEWSEIEGDTWRIPAARMKMGREHLVPLTGRAKAILKTVAEMQQSERWVFPGVRGPMSENTMLYALYRMGYHRRATIHGMRGLGSTVLHEDGRWRSEAIEKQLAHDDNDQVRAAYNSAEYWPERVRMMNWWSDYLEGQRGLGELLG